MCKLTSELQSSKNPGQYVFNGYLIYFGEPQCVTGSGGADCQTALHPSVAPTVAGLQSRTDSTDVSE